MQKKIFVSGSIAYDNVMTYNGKFTDLIKPQALQNLSIAFLIADKSVHFGGCAGNIAYSLTLLKEKPIVSGTAGRDFADYEKWMQKNGIDTLLIDKIADLDTACAFITSDEDGRQITSFYPGAMKKVRKVDLKKIKNKIALALISPENEKTMLHISWECKKNKIPYFFDPGQQLPAFTGDELRIAIKGAKGLFLNEYEYEMFKEKARLTEKQILQETEMLIVTKGEKGSVIKLKNETIEIPIVKPKKIVDPTGCGDAYRAGFLKGLKDELFLDKCGMMGAKMAAKAIEYAGTQKHG